MFLTCQRLLVKSQYQALSTPVNAFTKLCFLHALLNLNAQELEGKRRNTRNIFPIKCILKLIFKTEFVPKLLCICPLFGFSGISFEIYFCKQNFVVLLSLKAGVNIL